MNDAWVGPAVGGAVAVAIGVIANAVHRYLTSGDRMPRMVARILLPLDEKSEFVEQVAPRLRPKRSSVLGVVYLFRLFRGAVDLNLTRGRIQQKNVYLAFAAFAVSWTADLAATVSVWQQNILEGVPLTMFGIAALFLTTCLLRGGSEPVGVAAVFGGFAAFAFGVLHLGAGDRMLGAGATVSGLGVLCFGLGILRSGSIGWGIALAGLGIAGNGAGHLLDVDYVSASPSLALGIFVMGIGAAFEEKPGIVIGGGAVAGFVGIGALVVPGEVLPTVMGLSVLAGAAGTMTLGSMMLVAPERTLRVATLAAGGAMCAAGVAMLSFAKLSSPAGLAPAIGMLGLGLGALSVHVTIIPDLPRTTDDTSPDLPDDAAHA